MTLQTAPRHKRMQCRLWWSTQFGKMQWSCRTFGNTGGKGWAFYGVRK